MTVSQRVHMCRLIELAEKYPESANKMGLVSKSVFKKNAEINNDTQLKVKNPKGGNGYAKCKKKGIK